jgi:VWFA-related protein
MRLGLLVVTVGAGCLCVPWLTAQQSQPTFRAGTDPVLVDVQVVTRDGTPVADLTAEHFIVDLRGRRRPVASVEFIDYRTRATAVTTSSTATSTDATRAPGPTPLPRRTLVIAVDESSFLPASVIAYRQGIAKFIEQLDPTDLAGLYAFPGGGPLVTPTLDRHTLLAGVARLSGRFEAPVSRYRFSRGEMMDITARDQDVLRRVAERECGRQQLNYCITTELPRAAHEMALQLEVFQTQTLSGLRSVIKELSAMPDRKTVVVVSGGLLSGDRIGSRGAVPDLIMALGQDASRANLNLYVLHMDSTFLDGFSPQARAPAHEIFRDESMLRQGLEQFAGIAGGELFRAQTGVGDNAFARILRETSSYYLLAVEPEARLRDGRTHNIRVRVTRPNLLVRARPWVTIPDARVGSILAR